jgi:NAD(P)-dependent dehydrogenase (short-subunit alcohol dehydrogenase family)
MKCRKNVWACIGFLASDTFVQWICSRDSGLIVARLIGENMSATIIAPPIAREPQLEGQTVVVIGGSAGIGLETARRASAEGAKVILAGRNPEPLQRAASEVHALSIAAFDATNPPLLEQFFRGLPVPINHILVTAGRPAYGRLIDLELTRARQIMDEHFSLLIEIARHAVGRVKAGGTLIFMGGTGSRRPANGLGILAVLTAALPALTANLAVELAPVRVNLIAAGFVDTQLSASILGNELENRRSQLRAKLPIRRVVQPADVAALAVHIMTNTALTGATYDVDGGQQFVAA